MTIALRDDLLNWYDKHARSLPWRVPPAERARGVMPDPYRVWLSEIMLQQTTVATVKAYFERFTARWPDVVALAESPREEVLKEWAGLGYYARARNLHACAQAVVAEHDGRFPDTEAVLLTLPGIGRYTAAAVASIAFDRPAPVMDGNVERVMARVFAVGETLPGIKPQLYALAASQTPELRPGDYAQAVMDLGATICTPRNPACGICPVMTVCEGRKAGIAAELPRKAPKKTKPTRFGVCYLAVRADGAVLLEERPDAGLLGGMTGLPGGAWTQAQPAEECPPLVADWSERGEVRHTFTHFHLQMMVMRADVEINATAPAGRWVAHKDAASQALPTVMKKALKLGLA